MVNEGNRMLFYWAPATEARHFRAVPHHRVCEITRISPSTRRLPKKEPLALQGARSYNNTRRLSGPLARQGQPSNPISCEP
jgi:hypothetical protein